MTIPSLHLSGLPNWRHLIFYRTAKPYDRGFTLIELLVTIAIIGTLAAIAIPMYASQQQLASRSSAISDGRAWSTTVSTGFNGYSSFGATTNGTVALTGTTTQASPLVVTLGAGFQPTASGSPISTPVGVSNGSTITSSWVWGMSWCFVVANNGQNAAFTQAGLSQNPTSSTLKCTSGTASAGTLTP